MNTKKSLIYFTIGHNQEYIHILKFCHYSMLLNSPNIASKVDLLIMCDESYELIIRTLIPYARIFITDKNENTMQVAMRKLEIFSYPEINEYDNILYLDCDIVITKDISRILNKQIEDDKIYIKKENFIEDPFNKLFFGLKKYSPEDINNFILNNNVPINSGLILFKNTEKMKDHFKNILNISKNWKNEYYYDQSFINHYFQYNKKYDHELLDKDISFYDGNELNSIDDNATLINCFRDYLPIDYKLMNMKTIMFHEQKKKEVFAFTTFSKISEIINLGDKPKIAVIGTFNKEVVDPFIEYKPHKIFLIDALSNDQRQNELARNYSSEDFIELIENVANTPNYFESDSLDMVYVGNNVSSVTRSVMEYAYRSVRNGGWICGHGFNKNGCLQAVFCFDKGLRVNFVFMDELMAYAIKVFK